MCFSAHASFITAAVLAPVGIYAYLKSLKLSRGYRMIALVPLIFSLQQAAEGMVWLGSRESAYVFLIIAFFIWPVYLPLCIYKIETEPHRKRVLRAFPVMGFIYGLTILVPLFTQHSDLSIAIAHHSIQYNILHLEGLSWVYGFLYVLITIVPFLYTSKQIMKGFGVLALVSMLISILFYYYAVTSVWCFFVALISLFVVYAIHQARNN